MPTNVHPQPIIKMEGDASQASIINYNVPEPTTYFGNKYFELNVKETVKNDPRFKACKETSDSAFRSYSNYRYANYAICSVIVHRDTGFRIEIYLSAFARRNSGNEHFLYK